MPSTKHFLGADNGWMDNTLAVDSESGDKVMLMGYDYLPMTVEC